MVGDFDTGSPDISRNNTFTPTRTEDRERYIDDLIHKINLLYKHLGLGRPIPPPATGDHAEDFEKNENVYHYRRGLDDGYEKLINSIRDMNLTYEQKIYVANIQLSKILQELGVYYSGSYRRLSLPW